MTLNVQNPAQVKLEEDPLPYTDQFTYLGSTLRQEQEATSSTELVTPGMPSGC